MRSLHTETSSERTEGALAREGQLRLLCHPTWRGQRCVWLTLLIMETRQQWALSLIMLCMVVGRLHEEHSQGLMVLWQTGGHHLSISPGNTCNDVLPSLLCHAGSGCFHPVLTLSDPAMADVDQQEQKCTQEKREESNTGERKETKGLLLEPYV